MYTPVPESRLLGLLIARQARIEWCDAAQPPAGAVAELAADIDYAARAGRVAAWTLALTDADRAALRAYDDHVDEARAALDDL